MGNGEWGRTRVGGGGGGGVEILKMSLQAVKCGVSEVIRRVPAAFYARALLMDTDHSSLTLYSHSSLF